MLNAQLLDRYSQGGIYLGPGYAVPIDRQVHQRVSERIVQGLYRHHVGMRLGNTAIRLTHIDKRKPTWLEGLYTLRSLGLRHAPIGDCKTFQYAYGWAANNPTHSVWLLHFFPGIAEQIILAHTGG
jgi:hypothetical protein